ncbi:BON domain-containing protein [Paraburkholderia sp. J63]|uniref:BON domain-containing protein n=1 Tax=Paraburkholderia sp. J63 TaxID=2805434 RepID=UPI002ABE1A78|nr:BON domain-containing protein [Paraburkholderia sp. J63]
MKTMNSFKTAIRALIVAVSAGVVTQAWSQTGDAVEPSAAPMASATGPTTARAARLANRALRKQVYAAFAKHREIDAGSLSVTATNGAVTIDGTVTEAAQIRVVAEIARNVAGVKSVKTRLSVQRPLGQ